MCLESLMWLAAVFKSVTVGKDLTIFHEFSANTNALHKDKISLDKAAIQVLKLVKQTIRLHGGPNAVPETRSMISVVR